MKSPWSSFPAYLYGSGRVGIMAQAQLDDTETCDTNLIGTGPFKLKEWKVNEKFVAEKNPDYWQKDADGNQLPYLDEIEFRPDRRRRRPGQRPARGEHQRHAHLRRRADRRPALRGATAGNINLVESDRLRRGLLHHVQHDQAAVRQPQRPPGRRLRPRPRHLQQDPQPGPVHHGDGPVRHRARSATSRTPASPSTTSRRPRTSWPSTRTRPARTWSSPSLSTNDPHHGQAGPVPPGAGREGRHDGHAHARSTRPTLINDGPRRQLPGHVLAQPPRRRPRQPVRLVEVAARRSTSASINDPEIDRAARRRAAPSPTRPRPPADLRGRQQAVRATRSTTSGSTGRSGTSPRPPTCARRATARQLPDGTEPFAGPGHRPPGPRACGSSSDVRGGAGRTAAGPHRIPPDH